MNSIDETTDAVWSAIQRVSPAVSREEIASILRVALDAPTADEHPMYSIPYKSEYLITEKSDNLYAKRVEDLLRGR